MTAFEVDPSFNESREKANSILLRTRDVTHTGIQLVDRSDMRHPPTASLLYISRESGIKSHGQ